MVYVFNHPAILQLLPLPTLFIIVKRGVIWLWRRYQPLSYVDEATRDLIIPKPIFSLWSVVCKGTTECTHGACHDKLECVELGNCYWNLTKALCFCVGLIMIVNSFMRYEFFIFSDYDTGDQKILVLIESTISKVTTVVLLFLLIICATLFGLIMLAQVKHRRERNVYSNVIQS